MPFIADIWITLSPREVAGFRSKNDPEYSDQEVQTALETFHRTREAKADYEILDPAQSPLLPDAPPSGVVAVAATLGRSVESVDLPALDLCLKAALAQLQAYLNYRIVKRLAPKKLHLGWPVVPGGAAAPDLTYGQVLDLLPQAGSGVRLKEGRLDPAWSLVYLYPVSPKPDKTSSCASCRKDCALRN